MSTIQAAFSACHERGEKALVVFVTAGDPELAELPAILEALEEGGADVIEIGLPFSDPIADGPSIQASSQRALDRGVRPLDALKVLASTMGKVPRIVMGYINTVLQPGLESFADQALAAGVSGSILCDVTPEEAGDWIDVSRTKGLDTVFLAAPTSTDARLDLVVERGRGFIYAVSRTGVTGKGQQTFVEARELVLRLRSRTDLPIAVGFGISKPDDVRAVCEFADGAVVGSLIVDFLAEHWKGGAGREGLVAMVRDLKAATKAV
jgi:tryptophan synthase alpha chain